jgi:MFS family permease
MASVEVSPGRAWGVTALCASFMSINYADKVIVGMAAVPIMEELHLTPAEFGWLGSAFFLLYSLSAVGVGLIADRIASKWIIAVMAFVWAATMAPMAFEVAFPVLLICRIILGAAEGPSIAIANHAVFKWFPDKKRAFPSAIVSIGSSVGVLFSAPAIAWLIKTYNWHVAFGVVSAIGFIWLPIWLVFVKEGPLAASSGETGAIEPTTKQMLPPLLPLLTQRTFVGVLACAYASFSVLALIVAWLPPFLIKGENYSPQTASWLVAFTWTFEALMVVGVGWYSSILAGRGVSSQISRGYFGAGAIVVAGISLLLAMAVPSGMLRVAMLILAFSAAQAVWPLLFALIAEIVPGSRRGSVVSIFTGIFTTAGLVSPVVMGYAVQWGETVVEGYRDGFILLGLLTLAGGAAGLWLINPERDRTRSSAALRVVVTTS